jgi:hypothetical protein
LYKNELVQIKKDLAPQIAEVANNCQKEVIFYYKICLLFLDALR